jgi:hypothetical protein
MDTYCSALKGGINALGKGGAMSDWFSNRGQAIQVAVSVGSLILATTVAIQQNTIPAFWALIAVPIGSLAVWRLARGGPAAKNLEVPAVPPPKVDIHAQKMPLEPEKVSKKVTWAVHNMTLSAGQRWRSDEGVMHRFELKLVDISKSKSGRPMAEVSLSWDLGQPLIGENVVQKGDRVYMIPESRIFDSRETVLACVFTNDLMRAFAIRVDHIDPHSKEVEFEVSVVSGYDSSFV